MFSTTRDCPIGTICVRAEILHVHADKEAVLLHCICRLLAHSCREPLWWLVRKLRKLTLGRWTAIRFLTPKRSCAAWDCCCAKPLIKPHFAEPEFLV